MKKNLLSCIFITILSFSVFAEARNALLIANANYEGSEIGEYNFAPLTTPIKEAENLAEVLKGLNFKVTILKDCSQSKMQKALEKFSRLLEEEHGIGFFHYGGHAIEINGKNYLIPSNINSLTTEEDAQKKAFLADNVLSNMKADTNIIIFDSCREYLSNSPQKRGNSKKTVIGRGLALMENAQKNTIIAYSAKSGKQAYDGYFTPVLTKKLGEKKDFKKILFEVKEEVYKKTEAEVKTKALTPPQEPQDPYIDDDKFSGKLYLAGQLKTSKPMPAFEIPDSVKDYVAPMKMNRLYSFGLYATGNFIDVIGVEDNFGDYYWFNGFSLYVMWAEFNKKNNDDGFQAMLGSSYSYTGNGICSEDYGFTYHSFEIGSAYIGVGNSFVRMYFAGIGLGLVLTEHKFSVSNSDIQQSFGYDFLLDLHMGLLELNLTNKIIIRFDLFDWKFRPNAFPIEEVSSFKLGLGISL